MSTQQTLGQHGEALVAQHIEQLGWRIVAKNWRCPRGELDLVAYDKRELVFIEVRTRQGKSALQKALESVGPHKLQKLVQLSTIYMAEHFDGQEVMLRFDVFGVALDSDGYFKIEHVRDALQW